MSTIQTKFLIVSLPRTGTKSVMQMLKKMGFSVQHAPSVGFDGGFLNRMDAMADTPCFRPSVVERMVNQAPDMKFIYIEKGANDWVESMKKVGLQRNYNNMYGQWEKEPESLTPHNILDLDSLKEVLNAPFEETSAAFAFDVHRKKIEEIVPADRLLVYNFDQGWQPLADFVGKDIPDEEVPHLNQDTMFDQITD